MRWDEAQLGIEEFHAHNGGDGDCVRSGVRHQAWVAMMLKTDVSVRDQRHHHQQQKAESRTSGKSDSAKDVRGNDPYEQEQNYNRAKNHKFLIRNLETHYSWQIRFKVLSAPVLHQIDQRRYIGVLCMV